MNFLHFTGGFASGSHRLRVGEADIEVPALRQDQAPTALALGVRPEHNRARTTRRRCAAASSARSISAPPRS